MCMVSHWAVVGFGSGAVGSFQSKKNDWETDWYHSWNRHEAGWAYLGDVGDDVVAKAGCGGPRGGDEECDKEEEER